MRSRRIGQFIEDVYMTQTHPLIIGDYLTPQEFEDRRYEQLTCSLRNCIFVSSSMGALQINQSI